MLQNIVFDFDHIQEYWMYAVGILSLTTAIVGFTNIQETTFIFVITILMSLSLKVFDNGTLPNVFCGYLIISLITLCYNFYNYINIMDVELDKLSKIIETFGRESIYLDIINNQENIDAEFFTNYYKIRFIGNKEEIDKQIENINKIIIPANIKICEKEEIINRVNNFLKYIKSQKVIINSIVMNGFKPSNSLIKFYIKLTSMKKCMIPNNNGVHDKYNHSVTRIINRFGNKFKPEEMIGTFNFAPIPNYKLENENFMILLNKTICGIEKYFNAYLDNNMIFY